MAAPTRSRGPTSARSVSLVAGASLIVDYTLTVAVSIAAGVGALTSAFPGLSSATVPICLGILAVITLLNLRGLGETARAFLLPTMVFIVGLLAIIAVGLIHPLALHAAQPGRSLLPTHGLETVSVLLVLKAFSAGCSALTGVEAIANGVPLFKEPRVVRAKRTELLLGVILGAMLLGLAVLASRWHIGPRSGQTVLSQIMADCGRAPLGVLHRVAHDHPGARARRQHLVRRASRAGEPAWHATTTSRTSSRSAATDRCSRTASGRSRSSPARSSSPSAATRTA